MSEPLPVFKAMIGDDEMEAARHVLESGWLGMGEHTKEFEEQLGKFLELPDDRHVVAVGTGTAALHLALLAAGVLPGDEVITPAFNNIGDFQAIKACGAQPVFCDVVSHGLGLDVDHAAALVGPNVRAILPLHYMGVPCEIEAVYELAEAHDLRVIEDCCHAIGTRHRGEMLGASGDLHAYSFDPIKTMTCIDGGAVVCGDEDAGRIKASRLLGVVQPRERQYLEVGRSLATSNGAYDVEGQGFRYHLANLHAAIGVAQLDRLPEWIENRRQVAAAYTAAFARLPVFTPPSDLAGVSLFGYAIRVLDGEREPLRAHMAARGVDTGVHWRPGHWLSWLRHSRGADQLGVTDRVGNEITTLPLWSVMDDEAVGRVIDAVWTFYD